MFKLFVVLIQIMDHGPQFGWDDVAGLEFAKKTIKEIVVWPMLRPQVYILQNSEMHHTMVVDINTLVQCDGQCQTVGIHSI